MRDYPYEWCEQDELLLPDDDIVFACDYCGEPVATWPNGYFYHVGNFSDVPCNANVKECDEPATVGGKRRR